MRLKERYLNDLLKNFDVLTWGLRLCMVSEEFLKLMPAGSSADELRAIIDEIGDMGLVYHPDNLRRLKELAARHKKIISSMIALPNAGVGCRSFRWIGHL